MKTIALPERRAGIAPGGLAPPHAWDDYTRILVIIFFLTLPLVNPWVRGDGVGYYCYVRALLIEHNLDFANDWRSANESFAMSKVRSDGSIDPVYYTSTGHLENHFTVGPSILWAPFLVPVHGAMLMLRKLGFKVQLNGYSRPYLVTMALATAAYGFLGLFISFQLACLYTRRVWAFLATLGIWFASSIPVYMYFNPSWSHAHSVFCVALFLWYWRRTRAGRTPGQWVVLGLLSGLMLDVYYPNIAVLLIPFLESVSEYLKSVRSSKRDWGAIGRLFQANVAYCLALLAAFLPTLITRKIIYGNPLDLGYSHEWTLHPAFFEVLFSSDHGLLTWTPILILAIGGLFLFRKLDKQLATYFLLSLLAFYGLVSVHTNWDGLSSFGNRFLISLTPIYIIGLAALFQEFADVLKNQQRAMAIAGVVTAVLAIWNAAFIFQWGTHMIPVRGPISWRLMVRNQFVEVPRHATSALAAYFGDRKALMHHIEQDDIHQLRRQEGAVETQ